MGDHCPRCFELPPEKFRGKIPFIVSDIINELKKRKCEEVEGIFRHNGSDTGIKQLINEFNHGQIQDWSKYTEIHILSVTLKRYLRRIADFEPLIPFELYDCFIMTTNKTDSHESKLEIFKKLIRAINPVRQKTLKYICQFLKEISHNASKNLMTPSNLAICIAPNILVPPEDGIVRDLMNEANVANKAVSFLIDDVATIFDEVTLTEDDICTEDDVEMLCAAKINMAKVNYLIVRNKVRENSLIPYVPACRIEKERKYERPSYKPEVEDEETQDDDERMMARFASILKSVEDQSPFDEE